MPVAYHTLTDSLHDMLHGDTLTLAEKRGAAEFVVKAIEELKPLRQIDRGLAGKEILLIIDDSLERNKARDGSNAEKISCRQGCSYCCHIPVTLTVPEAVVALTVAQYKGVVLDEAKLQRQALVKNEDWFTQPREDQSCVFLREGECSIYEGRPAACRKHFSMDDPERCNTDTNFPGSLMKRWVSPATEAWYSAVMNVLRIDMMAKILLIARPYVKR